MPRIFLGWCIVALIASALALGAIYSSSYKNCISTHPDQGRVEANTREDMIGKIKANFPIFVLCEVTFIDQNGSTITALATVSIAGFTLTLWLATGRQAKLNFQQVQLAREEFLASHRPEIIVHTVVRRDVGSVTDKNLVVSILCVNKGRSPAEAVEARGDILRMKEPPPLDIQRRIRKEIASLPVGIKFWLTVDSEVPLQQLAPFAAQGIAFHFVGTISYFDHFNNNRRETGFYFLYDFTSQSWVRVESQAYNYAF